MTIETDVAVLGGGPAGYVAAIRASQLGFKTVLIEKEKVGGICLNWGCIPSKSIIHSIQMMEKLKSARSFGITGIDAESISLDWQLVSQKTVQTVHRLTGGVQALLKKNDVRIIKGEGVVSGENEISVADTDKTIRFQDLIIATGTHYEIPDWVNLDTVMTPREIWSLATLPESIAIIGAGSVGVEFALMFARMNVKVSLIEKNSEIMPYMDADLIQSVKRQLKKARVSLYLGAEALALGSDGVNVSSQEEAISAETYLLALRRQSNINGLDRLLEAGMSLERGYIKTDLRGRTTLPHVYAVGDVNGRYMLAHIASREGQTAAETIAGAGHDLIYDLMPYNLYSHPEVASVGLTEKQAAAQGFVYKVGKFPLSANGKALIQGDTEGFIKVIYDIKYGEILGVHMVAPNATDLIGEATLLMKTEGTIWEMAGSVHAHPTLSETLMEAAFKGLDQPVHTF